MSRPLRLEFPGAVYHVTSRGNARADIFLNDADRAAFLSLLAETVERWNWLCHGYCLMSNHYHLLIETPEGNLSRGMRHVNGVYTQRFNRGHGRVGHLLQGRFTSVLVDKDVYLLELCRYIVLNPVRAGIVNTPEAYSWSSFRATAGLSGPPRPFLTTEWVLAQFGRDRRRAEGEYQRFVLAGINMEPPWKERKGQWLLGGKVFLEKVSPLLKDKQAIRDIPRRDRLVNRPALEELLPPGLARKERNAAMRAAMHTHGYTQREIADHTGLHASTIGRAIKK